MDKRGSGILLHITSLPSSYGVGGLGPEANRFAATLTMVVVPGLYSILFRVPNKA